MKIISLNTWCGLLYEPLKKFIESQAEDTDIFCFQEVRNGEYEDGSIEEGERENQFVEIQNQLRGFQGFYSEMVKGCGVATFVKNTLVVENVLSTTILSSADLEHIRMYDGARFYPRVLQSIHLKDKEIVVHNFHGIPGVNKIDSPERELQTTRILEVFHSINKPQIIVGDFNLDLHTDAVNRIGAEMQNLIKEYGITTTRNHYYRSYPDIPFADFAFVSKEITVTDFQVLLDEVSDHLALSLKIA